MKNKMKSFIYVVMALIISAVLIVHVGATWYEYTGSSTSEEFCNYSDSYGGVDGGSDLFVDAWTISDDEDAVEVSVGLAWHTNVYPEFEPDFDVDDDPHDGLSASVYTSNNIDTDYTIYSFTSDHTVTDRYGNSETFYIGTSSK